jgi:hypothetical protein
MANITRIDPFDDLFRGFFVRPVDFKVRRHKPHRSKWMFRSKATATWFMPNCPA